MHRCFLFTYVGTVLASKASSNVGPFILFSKFQNIGKRDVVVRQHQFHYELNLMPRVISSMNYAFFPISPFVEHKIS